MLCLLITAIICTYGNNNTFIKTSHSFAAKVMKIFCIKTNYATLFHVQSSEISAMNGIRFLSAVFVIWAHVYMFTNIAGLSNSLDMDKDAGTLTGIFLHHMDLLVDTFFAFSGLLLVNSLLSAKPGKSQNLVKMLCKRYFRSVCCLNNTSYWR
ncbi:hypothetical protein O3G_MSEX007309 [Manduca sexta]|uniref:Acyltransferase 3 domain-containing protein n=1 Tax=Manduca sexta TaxID=7130 RepID=A0A921Z5J3_MANSE|nr:hypothetical protein O3G_MSEX007309 [Manduca sexta]